MPKGVRGVPGRGKSTKAWKCDGKPGSLLKPSVWFRSLEHSPQVGSY